MNTEDFDDLLKLAVANIVQPEPPDRIKEALADLGRAPLAAFIERFLQERPRIASRSVFEAVAALNQGTLEDLDRAEFRSYLISQTGITEQDLADCMRHLATFQQVSQAMARGASIAMAARDEEGEGGGRIAASAFFDQLKKSDE